MPAITLGLAEVEERLQAVRWRLNFRAAQHGIYLVAATAALLSTILILVGLRGSPATFRNVAWASGLVLLLVVVACLAHGWRRWSDIRGVARLVDERAQLTDRLTTLVDLRLRQRTSRLAPVLVAQTLALGARWQPHRIVPRRVPHSVFFLIAALLVLAGTTTVERQARPRPGPEAVRRPQPAATDLAATAPRAAPGQVSRAAARGEPVGTQAGDDSGRPGPLPGSGAESQAALASRSDTARSSDTAHAGPASLTDRLQQAIAETFRADKLNTPEQRPGQNANTTSADAQSPAAQDPQRRSKADAKRAAAEHARGAGASKTGTEARSRQNAPQHAGGMDAPKKFAGDSPGAGEGSSPNGLMQTSAPELNMDASASKPFTLTITSVPHAREARGAPADQATTEPGVPSLAAAGANGTPALSDRQLGDDALRKAEIPPEYEDVIRGVFASRGGR